MCCCGEINWDEIEDEDESKDETVEEDEELVPVRISEEVEA